MPNTKKENLSNRKENLAKLFFNIRSRNEVLQIISSQQHLNHIFLQWSQADQEMFLDCCTGVRGVKVLYDGIFKEIFNPEATPKRLEELLSLLLGKEVSIKQVLPNDSVRLGAESSLLYTDILVQLRDGSLCNVEIQKIGYAFPGQRCACYGADHLLRQYKQIRGEENSNRKRFHYQKIKNVYVIVFFEKSPKEFHRFPNQWLHHFQQQSDTGLFMDLLQKYCFIPLDIFKKNMENKPIESNLEAWLSFLSFDDPKRIEELITRFPRFKAMYQDIYEICMNMERVMQMYSKELQELDHNTVLYMMDEMQEELIQQTKLLKEKDGLLAQKDSLIHQLRSQVAALQEKAGASSKQK